MDPVGAMKSMMGMVGSNLVSSAKHATKQVVRKIRQKADPRSYSSKKNKGKADINGKEGSDIDGDNDSTDSKLQKKREQDRKAKARGSNDESQATNSDLSDDESDDESILDFRDRVVTEQEFMRLRELLSREIKVTNRGNSEMEKQVWLTPRRFRTTIRSVQIENLTRVEQKNVFLEFSFGGTLTEVRLLNSNTGQEVPRLLGYPPCKEFYTHTVDIKPFQVENNDELLIEIPDDDSKEFKELKNSNSVDISLDETFEWRGSYLHMERELFRIIAWRANSGTVNDLLGYNEDTLKNYATGSVNQMITLSKVTQSNSSNPIFRITLQIVFQEIYDFQLSLSQFTLRNIDGDERSSSVSKSRNINVVYDNHEIEFDNVGKGNNPDNISNPISSSDHNTIRIDLSDHEGDYSSEKERLISNQSTSCRLSIKFPSFGMDNPFPTRCTSGWSECYEKQNKMIRWDNIGMIPFRGTIHELERNSLQAVLEINSISKVHQIFKSSKQVNCTFSLKNIVYYPYVQTEVKLPDGETCVLEGKIDFGNIPKYHQLGNILEIDDENKIYLVVKIIRIDNLILNIYEANSILQETDSDDSMDIYVQLSFDGNRKETPVVSGTLHPLFQTELTFVLDHIDHEKNPNDMDSHSLVRLLERKGPVIIDVWRKNKSAMAQHLGWTEIHWRDILFRNSNSSGQRFSGFGDLKLNQLSPLRPETTSSNLMENIGNACSSGATALRRQEYRKFYDRNLGKEIVYETRVYQDGTLLYNLGQRPNQSSVSGSGGVSPRVYLEIWTKPDLSSMYNVTSSTGHNDSRDDVSRYLVDKLSRVVEWAGIGPSLKNSRIRSNIFYWEYVTKSFETWGRQYSYYSLDSRGIRHLLPTFLQPLKPLTGVDNSSKIHHFVHSFPFLPSNNDKTWRTPDLFLLSRQGTPFDHTLLQVCLLLGLNRVAFLACGTLLNRDQYSWAVTIHYEYIMTEDSDIYNEGNDLKVDGDNNRGRSKVSGVHIGRSKNHSNVRSISPRFMKGGDKKSHKSEKSGIFVGSRGKMRSLSPSSIHIGSSSVKSNSRTMEAINYPGLIQNQSKLSLDNNSIRFYALFWDTVKHVVYRVNDIIDVSKHDEFIHWLKEEGYDIKQLNELALESLFSQKSYYKDTYRHIHYKPNFCLKVVNKLPYRTLDLLVNHRNIYANIQQLNNPLKLSYNLNDNKSWFSFFPRKTDSFINMNLNSKIKGEMDVKGVLNQLPITQNSSNISACFSWPIINVVAQTGDNTKKSHGSRGETDGCLNKEKIHKSKHKDGGILSPKMIFGLKKSHHNKHENDCLKLDNDHLSMEKKFLENNMIMDTEVDLYSRSINDEIMRYVQVQRFQKSRTIGTRWNRENSNMVFLRMGLKLLGNWEMSDPYTREYYKNKCEFLKWRESFLSTVPIKYRMKYAILTFPCNIPKWIAQQVWFKCNFLSNETDKRSVFSLSVDINSWPNNIQTIRILILVVHPLKSNQLRKLQLIQKMNISNENDLVNQNKRFNNKIINSENFSNGLKDNNQGNKVNIRKNENNDDSRNIITTTTTITTTNNNNNSDKIINELNQLEIPEFPKELIIKNEKLDKADTKTTNNRIEKRASSIIFSDDDDEPELKLLHP
ncbi:putative C2 domain-containing protein [Cryptosporidium canis]|nr:putative C2 domain-containing protein [Cryptosporidium canis]